MIAGAYRALLLIDLAVTRGGLDESRAASILKSSYDRREEDDPFADTVARELPEESLTPMRDEVDRLVAHAEGDARLAFSRLGGLNRSVHVELDGRAPEVSRWLRSIGAGPRTPLRKVSPLRYLDFLPIGEGGMGAVYRALDTELNRYVALKIVRPSGTGPDVTPSSPLEVGRAGDGAPPAIARDARFLQEAWITGGMHHPGIVPVYELGETDAGVPYYTMQLVPGNRTLADAIVDASGVEGRMLLLESYLRICDTISYAHSRGVIHRDLKSRNVALGPYGEVFVLDWGLAKLRGKPDVTAEDWEKRIRDYREASDLRTLTSALGTPGHMAPEAAAGRSAEIDERSDVYSLGVVLFEILTGRLPFRFETFGEYLDKVSAEDPPKASILEPAVPATLSDLCARALSRDPADRPARASDLASAIRSWQAQAAVDREVDGLLIEARTTLEDAEGLPADRLLDRLDHAAAASRRVLIRRPDHEEARQILEEIERRRERGIESRVTAARHRALRRAGVAALVLATITLIVVASLLREREQDAQQARGQAVSERQRAESVLAFLLYDLKENLEPTGKLSLLAQVAREAAEYYESLPSEGASDETRGNRVVALTNLGDVFRAQGDLPLAKSTYETALDIAQVLTSTDPDRAEWWYRRSLCRARLAEVSYAQGDRSSALETLRGHARVLESLLEENPGNVEYESALIAASMRIGDALSTQGEWDETLASFETAFAAATRLAQREPDEPRWRREIANARLSRAHVMQLRMRYADTEQELRSALDEARRLAEEDPDDIRGDELLARCTSRLGELFTKMAQERLEAEDPLPYLTEALTIRERLAAREPGNLGWAEQVARLEQRIGEGIYYQTKDKARSRPHFLKAYAAVSRLAELDPTNADWQHLLVTLCDRLALTSASHEEALVHRQQAVLFAEGLVSRDPENAMWRHLVAFTGSFVGSLYFKTDAAEEGVRAYRSSLDVSRPLAAEYPEDVELQHLHVLSIEALARHFAQQGALGSMTLYATEMIDHLDRLREGDPDHPRWIHFAVSARQEYAEAIRDHGGDRAIGRRLCEEALDILRHRDSLDLLGQPSRSVAPRIRELLAELEE